LWDTRESDHGGSSCLRPYAHHLDGLTVTDAALKILVRGDYTPRRRCLWILHATSHVGEDAFSIFEGYHSLVVLRA
jgi:hypothetical protein